MIGAIDKKVLNKHVDKGKTKALQVANKAKTKAVAAYHNRGDDTKLIETVIKIGVLGYVGYKVANSIGGAADLITGKKFEDEKKEVEDKINVFVNDQLTKTTAPTISVIQAKSIANGLYRAFLNSQPDWSRNLWDEGTDERAVYSNLSLLKNTADWLLVAKEYGAPRARTLNAELHYELNDSEMKKARTILSKIKVNI